MSLSAIIFQNVSIIPNLEISNFIETFRGPRPSGKEFKIKVHVNLFLRIVGFVAYESEKLKKILGNFFKIKVKISDN